VAKKNKHDEEIHALMSFLAESVAELSQEELKKEYGNEPTPNIKQIMRSALKELKQKELRTSRADYESTLAGISSREYRLPKNPTERRVLLASVLSQRPDLRSVALTAQHRDLTDLTDADVESFLKQLAELGLLDPLLGDQ
jgi:hypothetical protein